MAEGLTGVIERITFHNLDNGYCVLRVRAAGHRELVTVVGHMPQAIAGEYVEAQGDWTTDRQHGIQFQSTTLQTTPPHTAAGIAKYLGSGLVKGIGPGFAKKIVEVFGEQTLDIINQSPTHLEQVRGIGPKRIQLIRDGWRETTGVREIMTFLMSYGIGTARAVRIYKTYGENAVAQVRSNPYRLSEDIWGVGFRTADELALRLGLPRDAPQRAQAAVRHVLREASSSRGHLALPESIVVEQTIVLTQIPPDAVAEAVAQLCIADELIRDTPPPGATDAGLPDEPLLYLKPLFLAELGVTKFLLALLSGPHPLPSTDAAAALEWVESKMTIRLAPSQRDAVLAAITQKVLVVTGGPGTGKTTIVRAILEIFQAKQQRVALAAPTGRAAKRLSESTGREAKTLHRLLEFDAGLGTFRKNRESPLDIDLLVIDESSMVDMMLMHHVLKAIPPYACVLFVGDVDQLPSVGPGSVLRDLIQSTVVPVARLTEIHRQAESSFIVQAAHAVNHGEEPRSAPRGEGDFFFVEADDPATVIERIVTMVRERIPAKFGLNPLRDVQLLSPMNKSELGVQNLNKVMQAALNPDSAKEISRYGTSFRVGDKVIQTQNNYQREVFNGDIGKITGIETIEQVVQVEFDGRFVDYDFGDLDELSLAYAVSIHKSQGSEYAAVIIPVHTQHYVMLQRNLLYTGITRGRKLVVLVGSKKALWLAVTRADTQTRFGLLQWRLRAQCGITQT